MKQDTVEKWILLEQSGELRPVRRWLLNRQLRVSAEARRFQNDLGRITVAARTSAEASKVGSDTVSAILQAARDNVSRSEEFVLRPSPRPFTVLRPALALAAVALIVGASWLALRKPEAVPVIVQVPRPAPQVETTLLWDDGLDQAMTELSVSLASSSDDWDTSGNGVAGSSDVDDMATELMQWEGAQI